MVGKRFGRLVVVEEAGNNKQGTALWKCACDCGNQIIVLGGSLRQMTTNSCGCLRTQKTKKRFATHGMSKTLEYNSWNTMLQRCNNPNVKSYHNYGERGITVCKRWLHFENFLKDMGIKPKGLTIERIDNDKGYEPENCVWASWTKQRRNQRICKTNTSGTSGIYFDKQSKRYRVCIGNDYKNHYIGRFDTMEEAIIARKQAEQKYWGAE